MQPIALLGIVAVLGVFAVMLVAATRRAGGGGHGELPDREMLGRMLDEFNSLAEEQRAREHGTDARLAHIEHAVEAMAIELERVGEAQRFVSKLLADRSTTYQNSLQASSQREPRTGPR